MHYYPQPSGWGQALQILKDFSPEKNGLITENFIYQVGSIL